jgi:ATP-dependent helicase/nuclease subunit B
VEGQSSSCDYCPYHCVCGFDKKVKGFEERKPAKIDKKEIYDRMATENAMNRAKN